MGTISLVEYDNTSLAIDGYNYLSNSGVYGHNTSGGSNITYTVGYTGLSQVYMVYVTNRADFFNYIPSYGGNIAHMYIFVSNNPFTLNYYYHPVDSYDKSTSGSIVKSIGGYDYNCQFGFDGSSEPITSIINTGIYNTTGYETVQSAIEASGVLPIPGTYSITYRLTNATTTGPSEATVGDTVTVPLTFPEGYGVVNPSSDAYVTCNGVLVPSTYSDGQLVFTMPDPS